ncbi:unnamed protein product [Psylliodes chrysocephalus]|uniref:Uncharacterized protein n=1 Tax=Psylliodes chrysocephalus TaxID=3402493 RepID=A0A9P0GB92_9CUCU|nr:unnamed protein product [Psylliodes chrysocephala]
MYFNMTVELNCVKSSKRFDFGVPLEDIFPPDDIHPRLKFIFQKALGLYEESHLSIQDILNERLCLQECLELKQSIIYDKQPGINLFNPVGAYFWIIRHFLGLLPIPLIPKITSTHRYNWEELSRKCRNLLRTNKFRNRKEFNFFNYSIAKSLNNLPKEHILMLNTVVVFIREVSKEKSSENILQSLLRYYCDAVFIRPFTPGHRVADVDMFPLMSYLVKKWFYIIEYLKTEYIPSFSLNNYYTRTKSEKPSQIHSHITNLPDMFWFNKNMPSSSVIVKYLKDAECQTDSTNEETLNSSVNTMTQKELPGSADCSVIFEDIDISNISTPTEQHIFFKNINSSLKLRKLTSFVSSLCDITEDEENSGKKNDKKLDSNKQDENLQIQIEPEESDEGNSKFQSIYEECNVDNTNTNEQNLKWNDVMAEIQRTVKKVENYNYDESYSSALEYRSASSSPIESTFSSGSIKTDHISFGNSSQKLNNNESQKSNKSDDKQNKDLHTSMYLSFCSSDEELYYSLNGRNDNVEENEEDSISNFSLKRLIFNFKFLKSISPKLKRSKNVFTNMATKNVKYKRFKS